MQQPTHTPKPSQNIREKAQSILNLNKDHEEGSVTRVIEDQTSKIPSLFFLGLALGSMALSLGFAAKKSQQRKGMANFIGLWAPTFLILGLYNKIVKTQGSDKKHQDLNSRPNRY